MSCNYLTVGYDCSPAAALRELGMRDFALPFDWVTSNINAIQMCFETDFELFHKNMTFTKNKTRLVDCYGFEFPHDYPLSDTRDVEKAGEGTFAESGKCISDKWREYYSIVLEKYSRRIERFKRIINEPKPIIVLCRYSTKDVLKLQKIFMQCYKVKNMYFVNSSSEKFENENIQNVHTERNNVWNDAKVWKEGIDAMIKRIESKA
jgi:hypothetical protein